MSAPAKRIATGYSPRPFQVQLHANLKRFSVICAHRRFGKSVFSLNEIIDRAFRNQLKNPQYAYLAPTYGQAKRVAWQYLKDYTQNIPGMQPNEADLRVEIPRPALNDRIRIMLLGAENPATLKGIYLDGVVMDEYAEMNPSAWREVIRPTLSDRKGWAIFISTPKGRNSFWELYDGAKNGFQQEDGTRKLLPEWFSAMYRASDTKIVPDDELESARATMTPEEFAQEYECDFASGLVGAYFSKEISAAEKAGRFTSVPYDPSLPVDTYWDLGINDVMAIWYVQRHGREFRVVDYFEEADLNIPVHVGKVKDRIKAAGCTVGKFYLPHDAKVRDLGTGKSREEVFRKCGASVKVVPRVEDKMDSIHAARMIFPMCVFDQGRCKRGIDALMAYARKWDSKALVFSNSPLHNWASNASDAFQQFAMAANTRASNDDDSRGHVEAETYFNPFARR